MSLTTQQKHDLIISFNKHRDECYDHYLDGKTAAKEETKKAATNKEEPSATKTYGKLYKHLGPDNRNKDVRRQLQEEVDMYTDNQLSTNLHVNHIPGYTMDKHNQISSFKDTFLGKTEEPVDKIYFRQKDEVNQYSEAYFKAKHILTDKSGSNARGQKP